MRILVITPTFLPALGGAELVILQIYRRLASDHSVLILTPHLPENLLKSRGSKEYDHLINFEVQRYKDKYTLMKVRGHRVTLGMIPPFSLSAISATKKAIEKFEPDVINVHYVMPTGLAALYAQWAFKIPTILTYNGRDVPGPGIPRFWKYWHKFIGLNCKDMTFVSKYCRDVIFGPNSRSGHIIYNGVEKTRYPSNNHIEALRYNLGLTSEDRILFSLQRLDYLKRVDILISSLRIVLKSKPNTRLLIGGKGEDLNRLKRLVNDLSLEKHVLFTGFIPASELPVYFSLADLFIFHSTYETFGIVLAEAMNYSKAIISADNTAIKEVVVNGKTGILVPTLDTGAFANAILDLLENENRKIAMGKEGKRRTRKFFQWEKIALQYERIFESVLLK